MSKTWVNLHSHDIHSLLDGYGRPETYAARALELGMPALATTNHGNLFGIYDHYEICKDAGLKSILGIELYEARKTRLDQDEQERAGPATSEWEQRGPHHLTVLAKNHAGYKNLIKLSSRTFLEGYYVKPRSDAELLSEHSNGLIVGSGCLSGRVQQALLAGNYDLALWEAANTQEILGRDNYFIEVMDHGIEEERQVLPDLIRIAKTINARICATNDTHYVHKEDHDHHDTMLCIGTRSTKEQEKRFRFCGPEFYLKSYEEMAQIFPEEWLDNTLAIAEMCEDYEIEFDKFHLPSFPKVPEGETSDEYFVRLSWEGLATRYGDDLPAEVAERAAYELSVIREMGYQDYFLEAWDLLDSGRKAGVHYGRGRGSGAASVIAYALRITGLDPLEYGLLFERFLNPERVSLPDFDLDTDDRDWNIEYCKRTYGKERVALISTFAKVKPKSAIRDAARVLGFESDVGDKLAKLVPPAVLGVEKTMAEALLSPDLAKEYRENDDSKKILDAASGLEGLIRQPGIHAAGVVIAKSDITDFCAVMVTGKDKDVVVTQSDMYWVERLGLLKMDFLGLGNLSIVAKCIERVEKRLGIVIDEDELDLSDELTYKMLQEGSSIGLFQLESSGMRSLMMDLKPDNIFDLMALVALYRPGPMGSGMHHMYVSRKRGRAEVVAPHPLVEKALEKSLGIMLYQEDVLKVITGLAGWSVGEADILRKVIGKKQMSKVAEYRAKFVEGCKTTNNISESTSNKIYSDIEYFAGYGFAASHAIAYGLLSYTTAYLKAHFPADYMASLLSHTNKPDELAMYLREAKRMGIKVLSPSIIKSGPDFTVEDDTTIRFGLGGVRGIGVTIVDALANTGYRNMYDLFRTVDESALNSGTIGNLAKSGALDELIDAPQRSSMKAADKRELLLNERISLGVYITEHPLDDVIHVVTPLSDATIEGLRYVTDNAIVKVAGIVTEITKKTTRRGDHMYILGFEDLTGTIEVVVFPKAFKDWEDAFTVGDVVIVKGRLVRDRTMKQEEEDVDPIAKIVFMDMEEPDLPEVTAPPITLTLKNAPTHDKIMTMHKLIRSNAGDSEVYLEYPENDKVVSLKFADTVDMSALHDLEMVGTLI